MNKYMLYTIGFSCIVNVLSIAFILARSYMVDSTAFSLSNMFNIKWVLRYKTFIVATVVIGVLWLGSSLMVSQFSSTASTGSFTATYTYVITAIVGSIFIPINFLAFSILRSEKIHFAPDRLWLLIIILLILGIASSYISYLILKETSLRIQ